MLSTKVGPGGRVLIPIELRRALDLAEGTSLVARVEDDRLILERPDALLERAKARFALIADDGLADELVAERRRESGSERHPS